MGHQRVAAGDAAEAAQWRVREAREARIFRQVFQDVLHGVVAKVAEPVFGAVVRVLAVLVKELAAPIAMHAVGHVGVRQAQAVAQRGRQRVVL